MADDWADDDVHGFLATYAQAWRSNRAERIAACWHADRFVFYKAEEVEAMIETWDDLLAYWRGNERLHDVVRLRFGDVKTRALGEGLCAASARMRWDIRFAADARTADGAAFVHRGKAMGGENHVVALLASQDGETGLVAWIEAPDAPLTYLRRLYFDAADPGVHS